MRSKVTVVAAQEAIPNNKALLINRIKLNEPLGKFKGSYSFSCYAIRLAGS